MWKKDLEAEACGILTKSNKIGFQLKPESRGFTKIISSLHALIDLCDPDITLDMNLKSPELVGYVISEEYLRLRIEEYFLPKIKEYCKKSRTSYNIPLFLVFLIKRLPFFNPTISSKLTIKFNNTLEVELLDKT